MTKFLPQKKSLSEKTKKTSLERKRFRLTVYTHVVLRNKGKTRYAVK